MTYIATIAIVGAGLAGAKAAEALRKEGFDGRLLLLGEEPQPPYLRPPLSKGYLRGESKIASAYVRPDAWYAEQRVELRTSTHVAAIEPATRELLLDDGDRIAFDRLLIATGAAPRRLVVPGHDLDGIHYLRTATDADAIRAHAATATRAVVIGGGWIGSEVTASLRQLGLPVALVVGGSTPLERVFGDEVGGVYRDLHRDHGVDMVLNQRAMGFRGRTSVEAVEIGNGRLVRGDLVVVGIGARPRDELARAAGLALDDGVRVDEYLESSASGIFAAGDVAAAWHPLFGARLRVEHWDNARRQGRVAAKNMLGGAEAYDRIPYFYSDQYDLGIEYVGHASSWDRVVFRGDIARREFIAFWLEEGHVAAALNANIHGVSDALAGLVGGRHRVAPDRLADLTVPLEDLVAVPLPA